MDNKKIEETVLDILEEVCDDPVVREQPDINLPEEDLIDSLGYMQLLFELEDRLGIVIAPTEYTREQMDTPAKIVSVVKGKAAEK